MGVLRKITDEYFGNILREEDGKMVTVGKHRIIIPNEYDVKDFFKSFDKMHHKLPEKFQRPSYLNDQNFIVIEGGDKTGFDLCMYTYDFIKSRRLFVDEFTEKMYNTIAEALRVEMADIDMVTKGLSVVAKESDFLDVFKRQGVDDGGFPKFMDNIFGECRNVFDVWIGRSGVAYGKSDIILVVKSMNVFIKEILSYSAVKEWFDKKLSEVERDGVEKYIK